MREANGRSRAILGIVVVGVLGAGAWLLLTTLRPGGAFEPLAPRRSDVHPARTAGAADTPQDLARVAASSSAPAEELDPQLQSRGAQTAEPNFDLEFQNLAQVSGRPLREQAEAELLGEGPDARKIAFLRALHREDPARSGEAFALAIRGLPVRSSPHSTSVPEFALGHLGLRAATEPDARAVLRGVTFGSWRAASLALRRQAAIHLGRASTGPELEALAPEVRADPDEILRAGFAAGLLSNPEKRLVEQLYSDLLAAREALAGAEDPHQDPESR